MPGKKTGTGIQILTPNKLLISLPMILVRVKAGNDSKNKNKKRNQTKTISFVLA